MNQNFKDFYDTLSENLNSYNGEYESFIDYGPDLFKLLCDMLTADIKPELRLPICGAIAYYVTPEDIIPEKNMGPYGYIDDIYLTCYVLNLVAEAHSYDLIQEYAPFDAEKIINECESKSLELLKDEEIEEIFNYTGIEFRLPL